MKFSTLKNCSRPCLRRILFGSDNVIGKARTDKRRSIVRLVYDLLPLYFVLPQLPSTHSIPRDRIYCPSCSLSYVVNLLFYLYMPYSSSAGPASRRARRCQRRKRQVRIPRARQVKRPLREQSASNVEDCFDTCVVQGFHLDPDITIGSGMDPLREFRHTRPARQLRLGG